MWTPRLKARGSGSKQKYGSNERKILGINELHFVDPAKILVIKDLAVKYSR
jgi:hypothetical protein